ncbi:MAG: hypothetical protein PUC41_06670 [Oscillospiraceae bacterium]|nr:hypothetical protein [Oscillospiraceae bacterium]
MASLQSVFYRTMHCRTGSLPMDILTVSARTKRLLMLLVLLGVCVGTAVFCYYPAAADMLLLDHGLAPAPQAQTLWDIFAASLFPSAVVLLLMLLSAFSAIGQPAALALLLSHGCAMGIAGASQFVSLGWWHGSLYTALCILPYGFFTALLLTISARDAVQLSAQQLAYLLHGDTESDITVATRRCILHFLGRIALLPLGATAETLVFWLLTKNR